MLSKQAKYGDHGYQIQPQTGCCPLVGQCEYMPQCKSARLPVESLSQFYASLKKIR